MNFKITNDAQLVLLLLFAVVLLARHRLSWIERWRNGILAVLAAVSLAAYLNFFQMHEFFGASQPYEFYHYYVGAKYFPELGYSGLYEATVVADFEDDREGFIGFQTVRNLRTYDLDRRQQVMERAEAIKHPFSTQRWEEFKRDIAYFRGRAPGLWRSSRIQRDYGYNGTPLNTAILGGIAWLVPAPVEVFVPVMAWLDLGLILGVGVLIGRLAGTTAGLLFVFLWAVNPFNPYGYIGGAYLRYLYFAALGLGMVCLERGRQICSGALTAVACLLSLFPALLAGAMLIRDLLIPDRRQALRTHLPFYASLAAVASVLVLVTSLIPTPNGTSPWPAFREAISVHSGELSHNHVGLTSVFSYHPDHDMEGIRRRGPDGKRRRWRDEGAATLQARALPYRMTQLALLLATLVFLRRASPLQAWFGGVTAIYAFVPLSHYYYTLFSLVPFMFGRKERALLPLAGFWLVVTLLRQLDVLEGVLDRLLFAASGAAGIYLVGALIGEIVRSRRRPSR